MLYMSLTIILTIMGDVNIFYTQATFHNFIAHVWDIGRYTQSYIYIFFYTAVIKSSQTLVGPSN